MLPTIALLVVSCDVFYNCINFAQAVIFMDVKATVAGEPEDVDEGGLNRTKSQRISTVVMKKSMDEQAGDKASGGCTLTTTLLRNDARSSVTIRITQDSHWANSSRPSFWEYWRWGSTWEVPIKPC